MTMLSLPCTLLPRRWGLGCVMYEMSALKPAFSAFNMEGLAKKAGVLKHLGGVLKAGPAFEWLFSSSSCRNEAPRLRSWCMPTGARHEAPSTSKPESLYLSTRSYPHPAWTQVTRTPPPALPAHYSEQWRGIIKALLTKDEGARPSAEEVLALPWLQVGWVTHRACLMVCLSAWLVFASVSVGMPCEQGYPSCWCMLLEPAHARMRAGRGSRPVLPVGVNLCP